MYTLAARRGAFLLVVILFLVSILLEQAIAGVCPWLGQLGGVRPSVVFLDIPLETPVTIDWLPVGLLFVLFYGLVGGGRGEEKPRGEIRRRGWLILGRWWLLLLLLLIGGALFFFAGDFLPKAVRNGIDSFGVRADLILPYPSGEIVHLHGSMIMLVFVVWGWRLLINAAAPRFAAPDCAGTAGMAGPAGVATGTCTDGTGTDAIGRAAPAAAAAAAAAARPAGVLPPVPRPAGNPAIMAAKGRSTAGKTGAVAEAGIREKAGVLGERGALGRTGAERRIGAPGRASALGKIGALEKVGALEKMGTAPDVSADKSVVAAPPLMSAGAETDGPGQRRIVMRIPEPVEMGSRAGRPCVYVSMPHGIERKRNSYPCVVEGGIKPTAGACK